MNSHDIMLVLLSSGATAFVALVIFGVFIRRAMSRCVREVKATGRREAEEVAETRAEFLKLKKQAEEKTNALERTQKAVLNILEDVQDDRNTLARLTERFALATKSGNIGVLELNFISQAIELDAIAAALYGLPAKETSLSLAQWKAYVHPDDGERIEGAMQRAISGDGIFEEEFRIVVQGVGPRDIKGAARVERDAQGAPTRMIGVNIDISAEKAAERLKNEFISLASHQLRTPLTAMKWATELLLKKRDSMPKEQVQYLDRILQSETRMVNLVNGMLNISRLDSGVLEIAPAPTSLQKFLQNAMTDFGLVAEQTGITVNMEFPAEDIVIPLDGGVFGTIVENVISNAFKYTPKGGKVTVRVRRDAQNVLVEIADTGLGIPKAAQARIFEKFFRADNAKASPVEGTGLGLYTAKSMARQAGGELSFVSEEGKGTMFTLTLPETGMKKRTGSKRVEQVNLHAIS